jgi:DNA replication protein DnaC
VVAQQHKTQPDEPDDLAQAENADHQLGQSWDKRWDKKDHEKARHQKQNQLVILDEFGYVPFSSTGAQLLFQFCAALHERVSLLITTNLPFSDWVQVLGDERLTSGLLDRLTFRCHILEFLGDSFRFRHGLERAHAASASADLDG